MIIQTARYLDETSGNVILNDEYAQHEFSGRYTADLVAYQNAEPQSGWYTQKAAYEQFLLDVTDYEIKHQAWIDAGSDPETEPFAPEIVEEQSPVNPDDIVPGTISPYDKYYGVSDEEFKEQQLDSVDAQCKQHIHSYWSAEAQANVSLGLYEQTICELCKAEISSALAENKVYIDHIETLTTIAEIEAYVATITRATLTGGRV